MPFGGDVCFCVGDGAFRSNVFVGALEGVAVSGGLDRTGNDLRDGRTVVGCLFVGDACPSRLARETGVAAGFAGLFDRTDNAGEVVRMEFDRATPTLGVRWWPNEGLVASVGRLGPAAGCCSNPCVPFICTGLTNRP